MLQNQHLERVDAKTSRSHRSVRQALKLGLLGIGVIGLAFAQTSKPDLAFEVASVRPSQSTSARFAMSGGPGTSDPGRISYTNIMLRRVLLAAYEVNNYQISGPDWLDSLRFDIVATVPTGATKEQFQSMLRNLLATRFKMTIRRESRELPIYALLIAKNGLKLKAAADESAPAGKTPENQLPIVQKDEGKDGFPEVSMRSPGMIIETRNGRARVTAKEVSLSKFADLLTGRLDRPVVNMTDQTGNYNFVLYFAPEGSNPDVVSDPGLFAALPERLGLRLEPRKGAVEFLVVDHAEKVPTEN